LTRNAIVLDIKHGWASEKMHMSNKIRISKCSKLWIGWGVKKLK